MINPFKCLFLKLLELSHLSLTIWSPNLKAMLELAAYKHKVKASVTIKIINEMTCSLC